MSSMTLIPDLYVDTRSLSPAPIIHTKPIRTLPQLGRLDDNYPAVSDLDMKSDSLAYPGSPSSNVADDISRLLERTTLMLSTRARSQPSRGTGSPTTMSQVLDHEFAPERQDALGLRSRTHTPKESIWSFGAFDVHYAVFVFVLDESHLPLSVLFHSSSPLQ